MAVSAGTAVLQVAPQLVKSFSRDLVGQMAGPAQRTANKTGKETGRTFGRQFGVSARTGLGPVTGIVRGFGGALAGAFAGVAVISGLKATISAASDLQETLNKNKVVFGSSARSIEQWSKNSASSFGLSRNAALGAAAQFGEMFHQLGFTQKQAAKTSTSLVQTAADLGSFHNVDPSDVLDRIGAALRGEYDSLQQLIPNINAARVEQEALRMTHKTSAKDITAAEKATAVLAIVQRDGANAAGDFAKTSDNAANRQRILAARMEDLKAAIGRGLLPAWNALLGVVLDKVIPAFSRVAPIVKTIGGGFRAFGKALNDPDITSNGFAGVMERIAGVLRSVWDWTVRAGRTLMGILGPAFTSIVESVKPAIGVFVRGLLPGLNTLWQVIKAQVLPALKLVAAIIGVTLFAALKYVLPLLLRIAGPVLGFLFKQLGQTIQWISNVIRWIGRIGAAFLRWITGTKTTGAAVVKLAQTAVAQFRAMGNAAKAMWERVLKPAFLFIARAWLTTVGVIVRGAATALGWVPGIGPKLRAAAKKFGEFATGVNKALNNIDDEGVNVKLKSTFTPPKGFSMHSIVGAQRGMRLPGYGGGDRIPAMLEAGEAVVPKHDARDPGFQSWAASKGIPGFARGGLVPGLQLFSPKSMEKTQEGIDQRVAEKTAAGIARNFKLLAFPHGGVGGTGVGGTVGNAANAWRVFRSAFGLPMGGRAPRANASDHPYGKAIDVMTSNRALHRAIINLGKQLPGAKYWISYRQIGHARNGFNPNYYGGPSPHTDHVHWSFYRRGGRVADNGAVLSPGMNLLENRTGKPEPLMPPGSGIDYDRLGRAVAAALQANPPQLHVDGRRMDKQLANARVWNARR